VRNEALFAANNIENTLKDGYESISVKVHEIFEFMRKLWGEEYIESAIEKGNVAELVESKEVENRVYALQKLILKEDERIDDLLLVLDRVQVELARIVAKKQVEDKLQQEVDKLLDEKHGKMLDEIKLSILKKQRGPENLMTFKKLVGLQKLDTIKLSTTIMEHLRPGNLEELVGQENAVDAILSKLATPYPQHMILYGPPGVGKTTTARLALDVAKKLSTSCFRDKAAFVEVDGTTLRWDKGDATNPLLGSVHDPIYQGSKRDLAEMGIPEPKTGLVTEAHGGILFIDEIGEIDPALQNKLLKVLEDKRVDFTSSYYDPEDKNVPAYIKKLFEEGAPADFILIGATTRQPGEINPALRSRCAEVYFEPLTKDSIQNIVVNAAAKLEITMEENVPKLVSDYTIEGRKAVNILSDAFGNAIYKNGTKDVHITSEDVYKSAARARLVPHSKAIKTKSEIGPANGNDSKANDESKSKSNSNSNSNSNDISKRNNNGNGNAEETVAIDADNNIDSGECFEIGRVNGLGVSGFIGSVLEIEAVAFKREENNGNGIIRFNDTAGSMAKDSVFNAASVIRTLEGIDISGFDIHANIIGGGNVDGPSAGAAITVAILSAVTKKPVRQDVAITGEISLLGHIKPVGGIIEKIYGASQAGISKVIIPYENRNEIPKELKDMEVIPVCNIKEVLEIVF
jgi:ATP-dependent Lon protease